MTALPWVRNYDTPLNSRGDPMPPNIQATYMEGDIITVEMMVTTHHKGHFVISACPIVPILDAGSTIDDWLPMAVPTQECFDAYKLTFVEDELYGAPPDPNYPERAYIAPAMVAQWTSGVGPVEQPVLGAEYKMKFQLPEGLNGEVVLIQWYYLTANSCKHEGYADYEFPSSWGSDVNNYKQMEDCENVPPDGNGVPEQFWNCGEVKIERKPGSDSSPDFVDAYYSTSNMATSENVTDSPNVTDVDFAYSPNITDVDAMDSPNVTDVDAMESPNITDAIVADSLNVTDGNFAALENEAPDSQKPCADASGSYYEANSDCTGYIWCISGVPGDEYLCGDGMLYDKTNQICNWADEVHCATTSAQAAALGESLSPVPPTPHPTTKPNALLDWDRSSMKRPHDKTIIGYYASWQWYDRDGLAAPINLDFSKITRANFGNIRRNSMTLFQPQHDFNSSALTFA